MIDLDAHLIRLIQSALTTIDGLWFLEVEEVLGVDKAFEIDLKVWKRYGALIIRRIKKVLSIESNDLESFLEVLDVICKIDGTQFVIKEKKPNQVKLEIQYCPWWENLKRSNRERLIRCDIVDKIIIPEWAKSFNPKIQFELLKSLPSGQRTCEWLITLEG
ncbi:MAG: DUF6125 family protein [Candidatus Helarchaeota archaeon]